MKLKDLKIMGLLTVFTILIIGTAGCTQQASTQITATATATATVTPQETNKTLTDMGGRTAVVPAVIDQVLGTTMPVALPIYMLAPDKLMGWNSQESAPKKYIPEKYLKLQVVGVLGGGGNPVGNPETYLQLNPDIVIQGFTTDLTTVESIRSQLDPIPVVAVQDISNASAYTGEIRFLGDLLGNPEKAEKLVTFYEKVYKQINGTVAAVPAKEKKRVYYAEGKWGLATDPSGSTHSQLIDICGGINVATVPLKGGNGMSQVNMEQVLAWNPDVIIVSDQGFYSGIYNNTTWKSVKAVQNGQVYLVPGQPFNWFDRPTGVNTIIGIPWTAKVLYPEKFTDLDLKGLTKEFYSEFYHYDLTDEETAKILRESGLKGY